MSDRPDNTETDLDPIPEPIITTGHGFSLIWLLPAVAALVAAWLVYRSFASTGPLVTVSFKNAAGISAGKTQVRLKDVQVGQVETVKLGPRLDQVLVGIRMVPDSDRLLTKGATWWVVRPRITAREVSGLSTLLSGAHIEMTPGAGGHSENFFVGLEVPPVVSADEPGSEFELNAESLGSVDAGSPVYYRRIPVGYVTKHELRPDGQRVRISVFVQSPYDKLVRDNTHFWAASGIDIDVSADGFKVRTESLVALLSGGIAFDLPREEPPGPRAEAGDSFVLFPSRADSEEEHYALSLRFLAYFSGSVRGLSPGAPVEFRGVQVGKVERISLETATATSELRIAVLLSIQPGRVNDHADVQGDAEQGLARLVNSGLRAQLRSASLVTGKRFVALDLFPDEPPAPVIANTQYPVIPTVPETLQAITTRVSSLLDKLDQLPLQAIAEEARGTVAGVNQLVNGPELKQAIERLNASMAQLEAFSVQMNRSIVPNVNSALEQADKMFHGASAVVAPDTPLHRELVSALRDLSAAARAIRNTAEYLERHPDSLLKGKTGRR